LPAWAVSTAAVLRIGVRTGDGELAAHAVEQLLISR
jgi:hypothetical protein